MLKNKQLKGYICISLDTDKDCDLLHDRPVLSTGRTPCDKQNRNSLDYSQNLVTSPGGDLTPRRTDRLTDRPTDRQLHSNSDSEEEAGKATK